MDVNGPGGVHPIMDPRTDHAAIHAATLAKRALDLAIKHERPFNEIVELCRALVAAADKINK